MPSQRKAAAVSQQSQRSGRHAPPTTGASHQVRPSGSLVQRADWPHLRAGAAAALHTEIIMTIMIVRAYGMHASA